MSKEKIRQIRIFFLRHSPQGMNISNNTFIAVWVSEITVLVVGNNGCAMPKVIVGDHIVTLSGSMLCKIVVSVCVINHAVTNLQDRFWCTFRFPDNRVNLCFSIRGWVSDIVFHIGFSPSTICTSQMIKMSNAHEIWCEALVSVSRYIFSESSQAHP